MTNKLVVPVVDDYAYVKTLGLLVAVPVSLLPEGSVAGGVAELTYAQIMGIFTEAMNISFPVFAHEVNKQCEVVNPEEGEQRGRYLKITYRHPLTMVVTVRTLLPDNLLGEVEGKRIVLSGEKLNALLTDAIREAKERLGR